MSNALPGSSTKAGYVDRRPQRGDYLRLLFLPPRDEDVLVADEIVYYRAPKHAMSLVEPAVETLSVLIVVVAILLRPSFSTIDFGLLVMVLAAIMVVRWFREREWGWGAVFIGVILAYLAITIRVDVIVAVTGVGLLFIARFALCILRWYKYELRYLTSRRIIESTGFLGLRVASMPVTRVTDLVLTRSTAGEIFGFGDLRIESAGQDQSLANIEFLTYPKQFHRLAVRLATKPADIDPKAVIDISTSSRDHR